MIIDLPYFVHQTICGGLAAAGFGVLFNIGFRTLPWCAASGALAVAIRTAARGYGWSLVAASFIAALAVGACVLMVESRIGVSRNALEVTGCIPLIPGGTATKAILGLFAVESMHPSAAHDAFVVALENTLRVAFVIGALGTGLAIPALLLRVRKVHKA